jgi:lysophospholipase L1-like esterase
MSKRIGIKCLMWGTATPTSILEQLVNKLGLQSPGRKIKATAWKRLRPSLLVLLTTVMVVACGGSSTGDNSDGSDGSANQNPVAADDSAVTNQDTAVTINVLANDSDPDGDTLLPDTVEVVSPPGHGTATAQSDGTIVYQPNTGFTGPTDSFTYRVQDNKGAISKTATVTVTIVNRDPVAGEACFSTPQGSALADIDGMDRNGLEVKLPASDPDNDGLTFSLNADGSGGVGPITTDKGTAEITDPTTGAFQYTPNLPPSLRGMDTFDYRVEDTEGGTDTGTITVIIDPKIMPLGDSITLGIEVAPGPDPGLQIGYRKKLYDDLIAAGFFVDFVGSLSNGAAAGLADPDHEGHSGATAQQILTGPAPLEPLYPGIFIALENHPADIVLLHIGTNDIKNLTPDPLVVANNQDSILAAIQTWEDSSNGNPVTVVLARIINQQTPIEDVTTFNNSVVGLAQTRIGTGDKIIIVNQETALTYPDDMADDLHPDPDGYTKMADVWKYALIGQGTRTNDLGTGDNTGIPTGEAILTKCP